MRQYRFEFEKRKRRTLYDKLAVLNIPYAVQSVGEQILPNHTLSAVAGRYINHMQENVSLVEEEKYGFPVKRVIVCG